MHPSGLISVLALAATVTMLSIQPSRSAEPDSNKWAKTLQPDDQPGKLQDLYQPVRGDSGKWNDEPMLQHAPPLERKPAKMSADDWCDELLESDFQVTAADDNWLLFRSKQLNDNDRVWVERIERDGNRFVVTLNQAQWQGNYKKNFTWYAVVGVKLGKLEPGKYEASWIVKPLEFEKFTGDGRSRDNWPREARAAAAEPTEMKVGFHVGAGKK